MLQIVADLHLINMVLVLATSLVAGVWGLILYFRKKNIEVINRPWRIALMIAAGDGLLQGLFGIILVLLGAKPSGGSLYYLHYVYGAIVALAIPVALTYSSKRVRLNILIFSLAALVITAAAVRAMMTGLGIGG